MTEPATALTDFLLAGLAFGAAARLWPKRGDARLVSAPLFFAAFGLAALLGGLWHGFVNDGVSGPSRLVWWLTVVATGVAGIGLAGIGVEAFGFITPRRLAVIGVAAAAAIAAYAWFDPRFVVSLLATATGSAICLAGLARRGFNGWPSASALAAGGVILSTAAGLLQQRGVAIDPLYFDHNATYHVILIPALALFYAGNMRLLRHA